MSALAGAKTFEAYVAAVKALLAGAGIGLSGEKPVPYGLRLDLRQGDETVPLTLYYGKKGFSVVKTTKSGSNADLAEVAKDVLEQLLLG